MTWYTSHLFSPNIILVDEKKHKHTSNARRYDSYTHKLAAQIRAANALINLLLLSVSCVVDDACLWVPEALSRQLVKSIQRFFSAAAFEILI